MAIMGRKLLRPTNALQEALLALLEKFAKGNEDQLEMNQQIAFGGSGVREAGNRLDCYSFVTGSLKFGRNFFEGY